MNIKGFIKWLGGMFLGFVLGYMLLAHSTGTDPLNLLQSQATASETVLVQVPGACTPEPGTMFNSCATLDPNEIQDLR